MEKVGVLQNWRIMSMNKDWQGISFISTMEHVK